MTVLENLRSACEQPRLKNFDPTWADRPMFTNRRILVSHPNTGWNDIYVVDHESRTAIFAGHQSPDAGNEAPLYDHDYGRVDGTSLMITSGPHRDVYLILNGDR